MGKSTESDREDAKANWRSPLLERLNPADAPNLVVDAGATTILAQDSEAAGGAYRKIQPQSIDEVRAVLGPGDHPHRSRDCCSTEMPAELGARHVSLADLESDDAEVREDARRLAYLAGRAYVRGLVTSETARWRPVIDRYLELTKAVINIAVLGDIDVYNGGTLVVSSATQAVLARHIRLHGTGQVVCKGPTTIIASSLEGRIGWLLGTIQQASAIQRARP